MRKYFILLIAGLIMHVSGYTQTYSQYFDGADTSLWNSVIIYIDTNTSNTWQIGPPQKSIFDSAATLPNAIITDTINPYPVNNSSNFSFGIDPESFGWGILALQWKQKLDMEKGKDGGVIEFWNGLANEWENAFNNPYVYAFYGFEPENADTLESGEYAFSGTDSTWRDIWLCFDLNWLSYYDTLAFRYSLLSDSVQEEREGWVMDNFLAHVTIIHSVNEIEQEDYINIWPNPTRGKLNIQARKIDEFHIIERLELYSITGDLVEAYDIVPTRFYIDISNHPNGVYFLRVKTNIQTETFRVILQQ
jgi:hypothetical protein